MLAIGTIVVGGVCGGSLYAGLQRYRRQRDKNLKFLFDVPTASGRDIRSITAPDSLTRDVSIIGLTSVTALIHMHLAAAEGATLLALDGIGYAGLLSGLYALPPLRAYREYIRDALLVYTGITFVAYFLTWGASGLMIPIGVAAKLIEAMLITLLWLDRKARVPASQIV